MTDPTRPTLEHGRLCQRRRPPMLRQSWTGRAELWCPECGRRAPADDQRPDDRTHP